MTDLQGDLAPPRPTSPGERTHLPVGGDPRPRRLGDVAEGDPQRGEVAAGVRGDVSRTNLTEDFLLRAARSLRLGSGARSSGEVVDSGHGAQAVDIYAKLVESLLSMERRYIDSLRDSTAAATGARPDTVRNRIRDLSRFGLVWTTPGTHRRSGEVGLSALGQRWLEAIPAESAGA